MFDVCTQNNKGIKKKKRSSIELPPSSEREAPWRDPWQKSISGTNCAWMDQQQNPISFPLYTLVNKMSPDSIHEKRLTFTIQTPMAGNRRHKKAQKRNGQFHTGHWAIIKGGLIKPGPLNANEWSPFIFSRRFSIGSSMEWKRISDTLTAPSLQHDDAIKKKNEKFQSRDLKKRRPISQSKRGQWKNSSKRTCSGPFSFFFCKCHPATLRHNTHAAS